MGRIRNPPGGQATRAASRRLFLLGDSHGCGARSAGCPRTQTLGVRIQTHIAASDDEVHVDCNAGSRFAQPDVDSRWVRRVSTGKEHSSRTTEENRGDAAPRLTERVKSRRRTRKVHGPWRSAFVFGVSQPIERAGTCGRAEEGTGETIRRIRFLLCILIWRRLYS